MRRGDVVTVVMPGDLGKARPALVVQADAFDATATVTVVLLTSTQLDAPLIRMPIQPSAENGLRQPSQIMIDKVMTVRREKIGTVIGHADDATMLSVNRSLAVFLGFG